MACPQGRDMVAEVGGPPRKMGGPLRDVTRPFRRAEGVTAAERSGRFYQLSIVFLDWFFELSLTPGLICFCSAFAAAQILRAERLDPTDERAVAEFALSAIQRHGYGEGLAPSPRVSPDEQVRKTCCLFADPCEKPCASCVCIDWWPWCIFVAEGCGHLGRDVGWGSGLPQHPLPSSRGRGVSSGPPGLALLGHHLKLFNR